MIRIKITSTRDGERREEEYEAEAVPRIGELVQTRHLAAARVTDVWWSFRDGTVTLEVR